MIEQLMHIFVLLLFVCVVMFSVCLMAYWANQDEDPQ